MRVVFFDIDGTLILSGGAGREALETAFQDTFGVAVQQSVDFHGRPDRAIAGSLMALHGIDDTDAHWARLRDAYIRLLPLTLARRQGRVLPGVRRLLDTLRREQNVVLALLTGNVRDGARIKLSHYGLLESFGARPIGGFGDEHRDRNQVARGAVAAVEHYLGEPLSPERIWVVGDTPLDIHCARAIGARVLAVATGGFSADELRAYQPDHVVTTLEQLFTDGCPLWPTR